MWWRIDGACSLSACFGVGTLQAGVPLNVAQRWLDTTAIYANVSGPEEIALASRFWRVSSIQVRTIDGFLIGSVIC
jgi:hypothetical protein